MTSLIISSLNLSNAPASRRRLQPAKPEFYAVRAWLNSSSKNEPLSCRIRRKQKSKLTEYCRASLDASQVMSEKLSSSVQTPRGVTYIKENVHKLKDASAEHATCGFEIVVPATLERAKDLGIKGLPYDDPIIKEITKIGERRLAKIPMNLLYKTATTLLYSLEGLENVEWEKILKLQSADGSLS